MSANGYFQFPLCLLALGDNQKKRLQVIVGFCVYEQAKRLSARPKHSLAEAAKFLNVRLGSCNATFKDWLIASKFVSQWEARNGRDAFVRIGTELLWEAHNGTGLTYREFSILCAMNSIIGKGRTTPRRITEPCIRVRAAGYKSWKVAQSQLESDEALERKMLTKDQVRYTLEKLHQRKLYARARVSSRVVKYMLGISDDELREILLRREPYGMLFKAERAKKDRALMDAIRAAKKRVGRSGINSNGADTCSTASQHAGGIPDALPDLSPNINNSALNNSPSKSGAFNNGIPTNSQRNNTPLSVESGGGVLLERNKSKKLDRSEFNEEELAFIDLYHHTCLRAGVGFLPITRRSEELDKVLEQFATDFDSEEWIQNFQEAVEYRREVFRTDPRKYNTLVQICWKLFY